MDFIRLARYFVDPTSALGILAVWGGGWLLGGWCREYLHYKSRGSASRRARWVFVVVFVKRRWEVLELVADIQPCGVEALEKVKVGTLSQANHTVPYLHVRRSHTVAFKVTTRGEQGESIHLEKFILDQFLVYTYFACQMSR